MINSRATQHQNLLWQGFTVGQSQIFRNQKASRKHWFTLDSHPKYVCIHSTFFFWFHAAWIYRYIFFSFLLLVLIYHLQVSNVARTEPKCVQRAGSKNEKKKKKRKKEKETVVDKSLCSISRSICLQWQLTCALEMLIQCCCWIFCMSRVVEIAPYFNTLVNKSHKLKAMPHQRPNRAHL